MLDKRNKFVVSRIMANRTIVAGPIEDLDALAKIILKYDYSIKVVDFGGGLAAAYKVLNDKYSIEHLVEKWSVIETEHVVNYAKKENLETLVVEFKIFLEELTKGYNIAIFRSVVIYFTDEEIIDLINYMTSFLGVSHILFAISDWSVDVNAANKNYEEDHEVYFSRGIRYFCDNILDKSNLAKNKGYNKESIVQKITERDSFFILSITN